MEKSIKWLTSLLVLQLILTVMVYSKDGHDLSDAPEKLLPELEAVDQLLIEDGVSTVRLQRQQDQWVLPDSDNLPANSSKITRLLEDFSDIQGGLPVATTAAAQTRLQVNESDFKRRMVFTADGTKLATLYVGTSPGLRQSHVRLADHDEIVIAPVEVHELSAQPADWEDKRILQFSSDQVREMTVAGLTLFRQTDGDEGQSGVWQTEDLTENEALDQHGIGALVSQLSTLYVAAYAGREADTSWGMDEPVLTLTLLLDDDKPHTYVLGKSSQGVFHLNASHQPGYFRLMTHTANNLIEAAKREALVSDAAQEDKETAIQ